MKINLLRWVKICLSGIGAVILLAPWLTQFAYTVGSEYTDLAVTHVPNAIYLRRALLEWHQVPFWSNTILSGYPFAANPLSGLWYVPVWLAALLPQPFGLNLMVLIHQIIGAWGFFTLMQLEGVGRRAALAGCLAFLLLPRTLMHFAAGHVTLVSALAWTPWLLAATRRRFLASARKNSLIEGVLLGGIVLADIRWAAYSGLLWAAYRLVMFLHEQAKSKNWGRFLLESGAQTVLAGMLSAPLLLPLLEYSALSTRSLMGPEDNLYLSLPPARLFGLMFPSVDGNTEWAVYAGALPLLLVIWAIMLRPLRIKTGFWLAAAGCGLLLAFGDNLPGYQILTGIPGFDLLRVPARFLLITGLSLTVVCTHGIHYFSEHHSFSGRGAYAGRLLTAAIAGFALLGAVGASLLANKMLVGFMWGAAFLFCASLIIFLRERSQLDSIRWLWIVTLLLPIDLVGAGAMNIRFRSAQKVFAEGAAAAEYIASQPGMFRVYSPSYSLPQQTAARYGLELTSGVDPLQLRDYAKMMEVASGVRLDGYSVALPALEGDSPEKSNGAAVPDAATLGLLNVRYVVSAYELDAAGLILERQFDHIRVYRNLEELPRARMLSPDTSANIEGITWQPNEITLTVNGPGELQLSEPAYPGWQVEVDGMRKPLLARGSIFREVEISSGTHWVRFLFRPVRVMVGAALALLGWMGLAVQMVVNRRRLCNDFSR